uniref:Uncharacterized protein n=1 Tax=Arundo donax TaxID=35708 RepID=A0A0A9A510_ARUDO
MWKLRLASYDFPLVYSLDHALTDNFSYFVLTTQLI